MNVISSTFSRFIRILETMDNVGLVKDLLSQFSQFPQLSSILSILSTSPLYFIGLATSIYFSFEIIEKRLKSVRVDKLRKMIEELIEYCKKHPNHKDRIPCNYLNVLEELSKLSDEQLKEIVRFAESLRNQLNDQLVRLLEGTPVLDELEHLLPLSMIRTGVYIDKVVVKIVKAVENCHDSVVFIVTGHRGSGKSISVRLAIDELIKKKVINNAIYIKSVNEKVLENLARILGNEASKTIIVYDPGWDEAALFEKVDKEITPETLYRLTVSTYQPPFLNNSIRITDLVSESKYIQLLKQFKALIIVLPLEAMEFETSIEASDNIDLRVLSIGYSRPPFKPEVCSCRNILKTKISETAKCEELVITLEEVLEFYMKYLENTLKDKISKDDRLQEVLFKALEMLVHYGWVSSLSLLGLKAYYLVKSVEKELSESNSTANILENILDAIELNTIKFIRDEILWNKILDRKCEYAMALGLIYYSLKFLQDVPIDMIIASIMNVLNKTSKHGSPSESILKWLYTFNVIAYKTLPYYDDVFKDILRPIIIDEKSKEPIISIDKMKEIIERDPQTFKSCIFRGLYYTVYKYNYLDIFEKPKSIPKNPESIIKFFILLRGLGSDRRLVKKVLLNAAYLYYFESIYPGLYKELELCEYFRAIDEEICMNMRSIQLYLTEVLNSIKLKDVYEVLLGLAADIFEDQQQIYLLEERVGPTMLAGLMYAVLNPDVVNVLSDETKRKLFEKCIDVLKKLLQRKESKEPIDWIIIIRFPALVDALHNILKHLKSETLLYQNLTSIVEGYLKIVNLAIIRGKIPNIYESGCYSEMVKDPLLKRFTNPVLDALRRSIEELKDEYLQKYHFLTKLKCPDHLSNIPYIRYIASFHRFMCASYLRKQLHGSSASTTDTSNFMELMCQECCGPSFLNYVLDRLVNLAISNETDERKRTRLLVASIPLKLLIAYYEKLSIREEIERNRQILDKFLGELTELIIALLEKKDTKLGLELITRLIHMKLMEENTTR